MVISYELWLTYKYMIRPLKWKILATPLQPLVWSSIHRYDYPPIGMHMIRCELSIRHIHGLPDESSRSGVLDRRDFKGIKWGLYPNGSLVGGSIGGGIYPNGSKTRYFTLTGQSAQKIFLDENNPITCHHKPPNQTADTNSSTQPDWGNPRNWDDTTTVNWPSNADDPQLSNDNERGERVAV